MVMQVWRLYGGVWAFMDVLHRALEGLAWLSPAHRPSTPRHATPQHAAVASAPPSGMASPCLRLSAATFKGSCISAILVCRHFWRPFASSESINVLYTSSHDSSCTRSSGTTSGLKG